MSPQNKSLANPIWSSLFRRITPPIHAAPFHRPDSLCLCQSLPFRPPHRLYCACRHYAMPLHIYSVHWHSLPSPCESTRPSALPFPLNSCRLLACSLLFASVLFSSFAHHCFCLLNKAFATLVLAVPLPFVTAQRCSNSTPRQTRLIRFFSSRLFAMSFHCLSNQSATSQRLTTACRNSAQPCDSVTLHVLPGFRR